MNARTFALALFLLSTACDPDLRGEVAFFTDSTGEFSAYQIVHQLGARTEDVDLAQISQVTPGRAYLASFPASIAGAALVRDREFFVRRARALRAHHEPDVAVVLLGTNDVCEVQMEQVPAAIHALVEALAPHPVLWLALTTEIQCPQHDLELQRVAQWNALLEDAASHGVPGLTILQPTGLHLSDGSHFTVESQREMARIIVRALDAMQIPAPPPESLEPTTETVPADFATQAVLRATVRLTQLAARGAPR
jgi:hypothetical protein